MESHDKMANGILAWNSNTEDENKLSSANNIVGYFHQYITQVHHDKSFKFQIFNNIKNDF